jgi:hypothetical protein
MSKSLINLNNNNKYILPSVYSAYTDNLTIEQKKSEISPEYVLSNFNELTENKQLIQIKGIDKAINRLNKITTKFETFSEINTSLKLITEMQRLNKEKVLPVNYHMFNPKPEIKSVVSENLNLDSKLVNKYIESELNKNYIKNLEVKLPLNLLNKTDKQFKLRNYLQLITKFNSGIISSKNISYKFNNLNNKIVTNIYTILHSAFLNMNCTISKPRMYFTNDLIIIKLFYFPIARIKKSLEAKKSVVYRNLINFFKLFKIKNRKKTNNKIKTNLKSNNYTLNKINLIKQNLNYESPFLRLKEDKLEVLCDILSNLLHKPVQLEIVRLHYPFYEPNILANILAKLTNYVKLRYIFNKIFKIAVIKNPTKMIQKNRFSALPGYLTGISFNLAGRLPTQRIIPRKTVKTKNIGSVSRKKAILIETARFSNKNRRGSFSITISTGFYLANNIE